MTICCVGTSNDPRGEYCAEMSVIKWDEDSLVMAVLEHSGSCMCPTPRVIDIGIG